MTSSWEQKSKTISTPAAPYGISDVVRPTEFTYRGTCHQWFVHGARASRTLPTICVHRCNVSRVSCQSVSTSSGHPASA